MSLVNDGFFMEDLYDPAIDGLDSFYRYPYWYRPRQRSCYYPQGYGYGYGYGYGPRWRPGGVWQYPHYCPSYYGPGRWPDYCSSKRWPC